MWLFTKQVPDLRDYTQNPSVNLNKESVDNIIVIIGESYSKYQSSLYGYEKNTNPLLTRMHFDGNLKVFNNIQSYTNLTIPSIKSIMTSYINEYNDSINWYEYLTLVEVMKTAGFKTAWLSNQSKKGISDNEIGRYADLCDNQFFIGNIYSGLNRKNLDEELIPVVNDYCLTNVNNENKNFIIIHLMGSHHSFSHRYPKNFSKFSAIDYIDTHSHLSIENRQLLAEYDNSVLYNDSIVCELINIFNNKEAIILYFPDHGIDPFRSSNEHIGHANANDPTSIMHGKQIPFLVYTTDRFKEKFPFLEEKILNSVDIHYRTDSIMYTIIDIAGIKTINGISYKNKSLFK
jgi:heptose-I-phosphate ethanolaminephosphotransferase